MFPSKYYSNTEARIAFVLPSSLFMHNVPTPRGTIAFRLVNIFTDIVGSHLDSLRFSTPGRCVNMYL